MITSADFQRIEMVNFPPRQISPDTSNVLTVGVSDAKGHVGLHVPDQDVPPGGRVY